MTQGAFIVTPGLSAQVVNTFEKNSQGEHMTSEIKDFHHMSIGTVKLFLFISTFEESSISSPYLSFN